MMMVCDNGAQQGMFDWVDILESKLDSMAPVGTDVDTVKQQLADLKVECGGVCCSARCWTLSYTVLPCGGSIRWFILKVYLYFLLTELSVTTDQIAAVFVLLSIWHGV